MSLLNQYLLFALIFVIVVFLFLGKKKEQKRREYKNVTVGDIARCLTELSLTFNGQSYHFYSENSYMFSFGKYQKNKFWGISAVIYLTESIDNKELIKMLTSKDVKFTKVDDHESDLVGLVIDFGNDFDKILVVINKLLGSLYNFDSNKNIFCKYENNSILTD